MYDEGKYLYCIIEEASYRNFGPIGIGERGDEVHTMNFRDLAGVISSVPMTRYVISRDNLMAHARVIEEVMKDYTVLPVRFGTVAASNDEVISLLMGRYQKFKNLLRAMDNKVEIGLKANWINMDAVFKEIAVSNKRVRRLKEKLQKKQKAPSIQERVAIGGKVKNELKKKKEKETEEVLQAMKSRCIDFRLNETVGDDMVFNSVFLIDRMQEQEFDELVEEMTGKNKERFRFKYVGPSPPFNFVNLVIKWGAEEQR